MAVNECLTRTTSFPGSYRMAVIPKQIFYKPLARGEIIQYKITNYNITFVLTNSTKERSSSGQTMSTGDDVIWLTRHG